MVRVRGGGEVGGYLVIHTQSLAGLWKARLLTLVYGTVGTVVYRKFSAAWGLMGRIIGRTWGGILRRRWASIIEESGEGKRGEERLG